MKKYNHFKSTVKHEYVCIWMHSLNHNPKRPERVFFYAATNAIAES